MRTQFLLCLGGDAAEKGQGEMNLICGEPADTGDARIQPNEQLRDRVRQFETNEKALRSHRGGSCFVVVGDRRVTQASQPARNPLLCPRLAPGLQFVPLHAYRSGQKPVDQFHDLARQAGQNCVADNRDPRGQTDDEGRLAATTGSDDFFRGAIGIDRGQGKRGRRENQVNSAP